MSKTKIIRYTVFNPDYEREYTIKDVTGWRSFETAQTMKQAYKKAVKMGNGSEIEQLSISRSGKIKIKVWVYCR